MTELLKIAVIALTGAVLALTVRRTNGEIALMISIGTGIVVITAACGVIETVYDAVMAVFVQFSLPEVILEPLFKCAAISLVAKLAAELCRQSGESALALKVELTGILAGIATTLPLLNEVFTTISGLLVMTR